MRLTIVGCGDAFSSAGRLQTCFHVAADNRRFLIDCGATALLGMERCGLDPGAVDTVFISHLHGDHFSGLIWWMLHAQHLLRRTSPLTIAGPPGIAQRFKVAAEALFPGCTATPLRFEMAFVDYALAQSQTIGGIGVTPYEVRHPSGAPSCALRLQAGGRTLAFSGDTEWADTLPLAAGAADLFMVECSTFETPVPYHLSWRTLKDKLDVLGAKRYLLTHMGAETLRNRAAIADPRVALAEDGMVVDV
ncbi:MAG: MBL fold metallo-hydrolase [Hyphomicrobiaceae bacterium]